MAPGDEGLHGEVAEGEPHPIIAGWGLSVPGAAERPKGSSLDIPPLPVADPDGPESSVEAARTSQNTPPPSPPPHASHPLVHGAGAPNARRTSTDAPDMNPDPYGTLLRMIPIMINRCDWCRDPLERFRLSTGEGAQCESRVGRGPSESRAGKTLPSRLHSSQNVTGVDGKEGIVDY